VKVKVREAKARRACRLALNKAVSLAFVANIWGDSISVVGLRQSGEVKNVLLGTNLDAGAEAPVQPSPDPDTAAAQKRAESALYERDATGTFPYSCSLDGIASPVICQSLVPRQGGCGGFGFAESSGTMADPGPSLRNGPDPLR